MSEKPPKVLHEVAWKLAHSGAFDVEKIQLHGVKSLVYPLEKALRAAQAEAYEQAAKIAEREFSCACAGAWTDRQLHDPTCVKVYGEDIAAAIRERAQKKARPPSGDRAVGR